MHRIDVVRALAELVTKEDLFICAHGGLRNDWWNTRPGGVDNTCFLTGMDTVSATALGLAVAPSPPASGSAGDGRIDADECEHAVHAWQSAPAEPYGDRVG